MLGFSSPLMEVFHDTATECHLSWDYTVLPATPHKRTHPALTPTIQAGTRFTYPGGMEGWVVSWLDSAPARSLTSDLSITSPTLNHCSTNTNNKNNKPKSATYRRAFNRQILQCMSAVLIRGPTVTQKSAELTVSSQRWCPFGTHFADPWTDDHVELAWLDGHVPWRYTNLSTNPARRRATTLMS